MTDETISIMDNRAKMIKDQEHPNRPRFREELSNLACNKIQDYMYLNS